MPRSRRYLILLPVLAAPLTLLFGTDCSSVPAAADGGATFIPEYSAFYNYESWNCYHETSVMADSVPSTSADGGIAVVHDDGVRVECINKAPPHGSTEYPVGTIIVKEIPSQQQVFAMVKRGGDYNPYDAGSAGSVYSNWEWFELQGAQDAITFVWEGLPPSSQPYSGSNPFVCNQCHQTIGKGNDFVASQKIRLENY